METSARARSQVLGFFLCTLLCVFALAAKTAVYQPPQQQNQVHSLTSAKMWKGTAPAAVNAAAKAGLAAIALALCCALVLYSLPQTSVVGRSYIKDALTPAPLWFAPPLSVRPPPTIL